MTSQMLGRLGAKRTRRTTGLVGLVGLVLGALLAASCTTGPQPFPLPVPNSQAIVVSNPGYGISAVATGLPGAAIAGGGGLEMVITSTPSASEARGPVSDNGSFSLWLQVKSGDTLTAHLEREGEAGEGVTLPWKAESPNDAAFSISSVSAVSEGVATVKGRYQAGAEVLIGNLRSGAVVKTTVTATDDFTATIAAAPGDHLTAFGRQPSTGIISEALETAVPP